ncbi:hypothetical protein GCM10010390_25460 [Streptomyces mordarskii]|uniref:Uncharacterized protein n=1 Tax=Streptomyces mordarskii TaxID=1226758 RepID=A0ABP3MK95_9ACTN
MAVAVAVAGYAGCLGYGRGRGPETPRALHPGMDTGAGQATERSPAPHSERADGHPVGGNDGRRRSRPCRAGQSERKKALPVIGGGPAPGPASGPQRPACGTTGTTGTAALRGDSTGPSRTDAASAGPSRGAHRLGTQRGMNDGPRLVSTISLSDPHARRATAAFDRWTR